MDLFRRPYLDRDARLQAVINALRASRDPRKGINVLLHEAVCRGGMYGLDWAAHVLSRFPVEVQGVIDTYVHNDAARRRRDRKLGHPRYVVPDEVWSVLLDGLARCDPDAVSTTAVLATLRRIARLATDGMVEGLATAAAALADRGPADRERALAFLAKLLARPGLSATSRRSIEGYVTDTEG